MSFISLFVDRQTRKIFKRDLMSFGFWDSGTLLYVIFRKPFQFFKKIVFEGGEDSKEKLMTKRDLVSTFLSGFFMNTLNPSVFLFWFAWTAAISANAEETDSPLIYRILVFGTCLLFVLLSDLIKVALAGKLRPKLTLHNMIIINRVSGIIILIFSAALFYGALHY